jgi:hypothetical protein
MRRNLLAWTVEVDRVATREAYLRVVAGAAATCGCPSCRNFDLARPRLFPEALREALASVGVDPTKEDSVRLIAPLEGEFSLYCGWYIFRGGVLAGRPSRGFPFLREEVDVFECVAPGAHLALRPWQARKPPWAGAPCVRLDFLVVLPWVLDEGGAPAVNLDRDPGSLTS